MSNHKPFKPDDIRYKVHHMSKFSIGRKQMQVIDTLPQIKLKNGTFVKINTRKENPETIPAHTITIKTKVSYNPTSASITTNTTYLLHPTLGCCTPEEAHEALREVNCGAR